MESQPQNPEFRINPENFHPCRQGLKICQVSSHRALMVQHKIFWYFSMGESSKLLKS